MRKKTETLLFMTPVQERSTVFGAFANVGRLQGVTVASTHSSLVWRVWTWGLTSGYNRINPQLISSEGLDMEVDFEVTNASTPTHCRQNNYLCEG